MDGDEDCNIRVICRFRPVNKREIAEGGGLAKQLTFPSDKCVEVSAFNGRAAQTYNFDKIFYDPDTSQEDIYQLAARKSIEDVINGYNSTIFAYGQTGAGKSFTMFGPDIIVADLKGIIPRSCMHIFEHIAADTEGTEYTIKCSFLEIYKENVRDLLNPLGSNQTGGLRVREAPGKGVWVEGLHEEYVTCEEDVLELLKSGERHRSVSATQMNATSSRSHSLFILSLHQKTRDGSTKEGRLNLADLAGSEKVGKTGATGDTLEEAKKINQSLSALGNCINALTKSKKTHVPYRDSKLTFILRESLGGNCKTTLLIACSPHVFNLEETVSTLLFGKRAKTIKNSVKVNKQRSVAELMAIIERLRKEMIFFKKYVTILEQELEKLKGPSWKDDLPKISRPSSSAPKSKGGSSASSSTTDHDQQPDLDGDDDQEDDQLSKSTEPTHTPSRVSQSTPSLSKSEGHPSPHGSGSGVQSSTPTTPQRSSSSSSSQNQNQNKNHHRRTSSVSSVASSGGEEDFEEEGLDFSSSANMSFKVAELQVELSNLQEKTRLEIQDLTEEKKSLQDDLAQSRRKIQEKKTLLQSRDTALKDLRDDLEAQLQAKLTAEQKLVFEIKQLTLKTEEQQQTLQVSASHLAELKSKAQTLSDEAEDLHTEKRTLQQDRERIRRDLDDLSQAGQFKDSRISELESTLLEMEAQQKSIRQQTLQLELSQQNLTSRLDSQTQKNDSLSHQIRDLEAKLRAAHSEKSLIESQLTQAHSELQTLELDLDESRSQHDAIRNQESEQLEAIRTSTVAMEKFERLQKDREKIKLSLQQALQQCKEERELSSGVQNQLETMRVAFSDEREQFLQSADQAQQELQQKIHLLDAQIADEKEQFEKTLRHREEKASLLLSQLESEKSSRSRAEEALSEQSELLSSKEKLLRRANASLEDKDRELDQQKSQLLSQQKSIDAQQDRIKRLEMEQEEMAKEKELLQQEVKTALEINIENAKQFQQQLDVAREETQRRPQNIRVPVQKESGFFSSIFGGKQLPVLGEIKSPAKFGFLLKRSNWLKVWEKRWFVLTAQHCLYYFDSNNQASKAMGEIEIEGCKITPASEFTGRANTFGVLHRSRKEFYLQAPSEEEVLDWVRHLKASINGQQLQQKRPTNVPRATQSLANVSS